MKLGPPRHDEQGNYVGPLSAWCGHKHPPLKGKREDGSFLTAQKATYSESLCKGIANLCFKLRQRDPFGMGLSVTATMEGKVKNTVEDDSATDTGSASEACADEERPSVGAGHWGIGCPLFTRTAGKLKPFADGCGICSPGLSRSSS